MDARNQRPRESGAVWFLCLRAFDRLRLYRATKLLCVRLYPSAVSHQVSDDPVLLALPTLRLRRCERASRWLFERRRRPGGAHHHPRTDRRTPRALGARFPPRLHGHGERPLSPQFRCRERIDDGRIAVWEPGRPDHDARCAASVGRPVRCRRSQSWRVRGRRGGRSVQGRNRDRGRAAEPPGRSTTSTGNSPRKRRSPRPLRMPHRDSPAPSPSSRRCALRATAALRGCEFRS